MASTREIVMSTHLPKIKDIFREKNINPDKHIYWLLARLNNNLGQVLVKIHKAGIPKEVIYAFIEANLEQQRLDQIAEYSEMRDDLCKTLDECGVTYNGHRTAEGIKQTANKAKKIAYERTVTWYKKRVLREKPTPQTL